MKVSNSEQQGDKGLYFISQRVTTDLDWIFRPQPHRDLGIDAIIEVQENNETKGELLALQIKSGLSYFEEKNENIIIFRTDESHIQYWKDFPIPVLVILHNPDIDEAYWQIVNENTSISTGEGWKIEIPYTNTFTVENKKEISKYCNFSLPFNCYDILSSQDVSHVCAKRYVYRIILNKNLSKGEIIQIIIKATDQVKNSEYYRNNKVQKTWQGKQSNTILLFVFPSVEDEKNNNWICRSQWIDTNLGLKFRPNQISGMNIGDDFVIDWSNNYTSSSKFYAQNTLSKENFLSEVQPILITMKKLVEEVIELRKYYKNNQLSKRKYLKEMEKLQPKIHELYFKGTRIGIPPLECKDFSEKFQSLISMAYTITLDFPKQGQTTRNIDKRYTIVEESIKDYLEVLSELGYEFKKLHL